MRAAVVTTIVVLLTLAYSGVVHWLVTEDNRSLLGIGFAVVSGGASVLAMVWPAGWLARTTVVLASITVFAWTAKSASGWDPRWVYLVQHAGIHAFLGAYFASTLLKGRTSIVTRMAALTRKTMPPDIIHYTRQVTTVWAVYFFAMAALSLALFSYGLWANDMWAWSILSNALTWPAIGLLACTEYFYRKRRFPNEEHMTLWESLQMTTKRDV